MDELTGWMGRLEELLGRVGPAFTSRLGRERAELYVRGLLANVERKNGWQLAEQAGEATPYAMQQFIYRSLWDEDEVTRLMRQYVAEELGDPEGVLVADETGFLKKGRHSVGVQRQYSGTAGRVENCQIGVFLGYASRHGRTLIDRALYLPKSWTDDRARCEKAGVPAELRFQTKPEMAQALVRRALDEGMPAAWFTADSVYGDSPILRDELEARPIGYVIGTSLNDAKVPIQVKFVGLLEAIEGLAADAWQRLSAGAGSQGERWYDWTLIELSLFPRLGWRRAILLRRSLSDPSAISAYRCFYPDGTPIETLVRVAGCRWTIETDFEEAKSEVGLSHYEVRSWTGWHRHISLAMLAHVFLAIMKATSAPAEVEAAKKGALIQNQRTLGAFKASRGLSSP